MRGRQRAKRRRREDELEEERDQLQEAEPEQQASAAPATLADKTLDLQKTAGNRAVGAALDRWSLPWVPSTAPPAAKWPKEPQAVFDGKLVVPIRSWSDQSATPGMTGRSGEAKRGDPEGEGEIVIVAEIGDFIVELHKAMLEGKTYDKVEIIVPGPNGTGIRVELENVQIASYQTSAASQHPGGVQSYQLSFSKRKFSNAPPPPRR
jgi:hypothetical protein